MTHAWGGVGYDDGVGADGVAVCVDPIDHEPDDVGHIHGNKNVV